MKNTTLKLLRLAAFATFIIANFIWIKNSWLGLAIGAVFLLYYGRRCGKWLLPQCPAQLQLIFGGLAFAAANTIILTACFYLHKITFLSFCVSFLITAFIIECFSQRKQTTEEFNWRCFLPAKNKFFRFGYLAIILVLLITAFNIRTDGAIASIWQILPAWFIPLFGLATILLIIISIKSTDDRPPLVLFAVHFFAFAGLALIIYKIGYGFDPFLHFAAIKKILADGFILPKTPYYIGGYSIIIFLHYLTQIPAAFLNKALVPISFAVFLPAAIYYGTIQHPVKKYALVSALAALFLPAAFFINTTPQGITNLLALIIIFLSLINSRLPRWFLVFLSVFALAIHPFYGAPLVLFAVFFWLTDSAINKKLKFSGQTIIIAISIFIFPLLFFANSIFNGFKIQWLNSAPTLRQLFHLPFFEIEQRFDFVKDLLYIYGYNNKLIFLLLALGAAFILWRRGQLRRYAIYFFSTAIVFINYFLTRYFISVAFVSVQNQRQLFSRITELGLYLLLPVIAAGFYFLLEHYFAAQKNYIGKIFVVLLIAAIISASFYFSYPVKDDYSDSQEYNVTNADIHTVHLIEQKSNGAEYVVLGNQMLASAAIREFGFKKYYGDDFYYSIPDNRSDGLYRVYEDMVFSSPDRAYAEGAMAFIGVNQLYFVVSDYWSNADEIIKQAKTTSDDWFVTDDGANYIFQYKR